MNSYTKYYLAWINILKGIGIILVVIGHTVTLPSVFHSAIYSFHMPLFFVISGYLFNIEKPVCALAKRLLLPLFVYMLLVVVPQETITILNGETTIPKALWRFVNVYTYNQATAFWFPYSLFISLVIYKYLMLKHSKDSFVICVILLFIAYMLCFLDLPQKYFPLAINRVFFITPLLILGGYLRRRKTMLTTKYAIISAFAISILYLILSPCNHVDMKNGQWGLPIMSFIGSVSFVYILILLSRRIGNNGYTRWLEYIGESSMTIMYVHIVLAILLSHLVPNNWIALCLNIAMGCYLNFLFSKIKILRLLFLGI